MNEPLARVSSPIFRAGVGIAVAISIALLIATAVVWILSFRISCDIGAETRTGSAISFKSWFGLIQCECFVPGPKWHRQFKPKLAIEAHRINPTVYQSLPPGITFTFWQHLGFFFERNQNPNALLSFQLEFPIFLLQAVTAIPPALWLQRRRRQKRRRRLGLCLTCGYDCREATDRCSECGMNLIRPA